MQERAGHGDVAVDARERGGGRAHGLGHRQRVLEQPVAVGLVVALGRRGLPVARPGRRAIAEDRREEPAQVGVLDGRDELAQVRHERLDPASGPVHELLAGELARPPPAARRGGSARRRTADGPRSGRVANTTDPRAQTSPIAARSSRTIAVTTPVRSPRLSLRYSAPSRLRRTSASRTSSGRPISIPSANSDTFMPPTKIEWRADIRPWTAPRSSQEEREDSARQSSAGCSTMAGAWSSRGSPSTSSSA